MIVNSPTKELRTVGLILGPYRNLTTLTASALSLHPECQVLNHAGRRLVQGRRDFIGHVDPRHFDRFCKAALKASTGGRPGHYGGSIQLSHAFDRQTMRELYEERYGDRSIKDSVKVLVWKDSGDVTKRIRVDPDRIFELIESEPRLRYLLPVRHPLDCAQSNVRTGHAHGIGGVDPTDVAGVLDRIVEAIGWFGTLMQSYPDRFFMFFQNDDLSDIADGLVRTLELSDDPRWREALVAAFEIQGTKYDWTPELYRSFDESVARHLGSLPDVASRISELVYGSR
jgi:hypothetical protein